MIRGRRERVKLRQLQGQRDCQQIWSDGRILWPRCLPVGRRGQPVPLVNQTLAAAIRQEASIAMQHGFGVGVHQVWSWRREKRLPGFVYRTWVIHVVSKQDV